MKYAWMREQADSFPISVMCEVLKVSSSGYYDWLDRPPSPRAERHERIQEAVKQVHSQSHEIYGSVKVAKGLKENPQQETACRNTVARCMRELGLKSRVSRRSFKPTTTQTDPSKTPAPNVLDQDFTAETPDRKWVTDISVPQKATREMGVDLPQSACRSRLQTTVSGWD